MTVIEKKEKNILTPTAVKEVNHPLNSSNQGEVTRQVTASRAYYIKAHSHQMKGKFFRQL